MNNLPPGATLMGKDSRSLFRELKYARKIGGAYLNVLLNEPGALRDFVKDARRRGAQPALKAVGDIAKKRLGLEPGGSDPYYHSEDFDDEKALAEIESFQRKPLLSIVTPVYNVDPKWLSKAVESVRAQLYDNWELCLADDKSTNPETTAFLKTLDDPKIKVTLLDENQGISGASNAAIALASGDYIVLMDNDDEITRDALYEVVKAINETGADMIYSDEDLIDENGQCFNPHFKPDYTPDLLLCHNYITHLCVLAKPLLDAVGGFDGDFDGAQDYDLFLKVTEKAKRVHHIRKVLYHWRALATSTSIRPGAKNYAHRAGKMALANAVERRGIDGVAAYGGLMFHYHVLRRINGSPTVSVIVPFKDHAINLEKCIESLLAHSSDRLLEVLCVDNGSVKPETAATVKRLTELDDRVSIFRFPGPFNLSKMVNLAAKKARGDHLVLTHSDVEMFKADWVEALLEHSQRPEVGVVGGKLYYADKTIQNAGVILGICGGVAYAYRHMTSKYYGYFFRLWNTQNLSALSGACLMVKKNVFEEVGGFEEEHLGKGFADIDFCLKLREKGYLHVFTPRFEAYHYEMSKRRKNPLYRNVIFNREIRYLKRAHPAIFTDGDPYYNPGLTRVKEDFSFKPCEKPDDIQQKQQEEVNEKLDFKELAIKRDQKRFASEPRIAVFMIIRDARMEWIQNALKSLQRQHYRHWTLHAFSVLNPLDGNVRRMLKKAAGGGGSFHVCRDLQAFEKAQTDALSQLSEDFVVFLGGDSELHDDAFHAIVKELNQNPSADVVYTDEEYVNLNGERIDFHFKPDYSPDLLFAHNYIGNLCAIRANLVMENGGLSPHRLDVWNYDLVLKVTEQTDKVAHVSEALYKRRMRSDSIFHCPSITESSARDGKAVLKEALTRRGITAKVLHGELPCFYKVRRQLSTTPLVSIVIPFKDQSILLEKCVQSILWTSTYQNYEILGVNNNSVEQDTFELMDRLTACDPRVRFIDDEGPFNFSRINNNAIMSHARGEHIILLNNDIEILSADWIEAMLEYSLRPDVGAVGAKLYFENKTIQHAGVVLGIGGVAGHAHKEAPNESNGYFNWLWTPRNVSAVTAACLMVKKSLFLDVNGLDEVNFTVAFNDVDFCLRLQEKGYLNVFTPHCVAYHYESASRGFEDNPEKIRRFEKESDYLKYRHAQILCEGDPFFNTNLSKDAHDLRAKSHQSQRTWDSRVDLTRHDRRKIKRHLEKLEKRPLISIIMPVVNADPKWFDMSIDSVKGQLYDHWRLIIVNHNPHNRKVIDWLKHLDDERIDVILLNDEKANLADALNAGAKQATGKFATILDNDDMLTENALFEIARLVNQDPAADLIYSDVGLINEHGACERYEFKPDLSPDLSMSCDYVNKLTVIRKSLLDDVGGFNPSVPEVCEYDMTLKIFEKTEKVHHVPKILYLWRVVVPNSENHKPRNLATAKFAGRKALSNAMTRRRITGSVLSDIHPQTPLNYRVFRMMKSEPLVSVIIPFHERCVSLERCVESILFKRCYSNIEILCVGDPDESNLTREITCQLKDLDDRVKFVNLAQKTFNLSALRNEVAAKANGQHLVFLHDDVMLLSAEWLPNLLEHSLRPKIGAVGGLLLYSNSRIENAGFLIGVKAGVGRSHHWIPHGQAGYCNQLYSIRNVSAVSGACLAIAKHVFNDLDGFDAGAFPDYLSDVDLCLRLREKGFLNLFTPYCEAFHHKSPDHDGDPKTKSRKETMKALKRRHAAIFADGDPYYNRNLSVESETFELKG